MYNCTVVYKATENLLTHGHAFMGPTHWHTCSIVICQQLHRLISTVIGRLRVMELWRRTFLMSSRRRSVAPPRMASPGANMEKRAICVLAKEDRDNQMNTLQTNHMVGNPYDLSCMAIRSCPLCNLSLLIRFIKAKNMLT